MKRAHRHLFPALALVSALAAALMGCTKDRNGLPPPAVYLPQTSEDNVLRNLQTAYKSKDAKEYSKLLATDFRFYFDEDTRNRDGLPEFWLHDQDSLQTERLFTSSEVNDIRIKLTYGTPRPSNEIGRQGWTFIDVLDTFLEVDLVPSSKYPEGVTLRVDGQLQKFFFRKGKTADDTLSTSGTKSFYYITEWRDYGTGGGGKPEFVNANP